MRGKHFNNGRLYEFRGITPADAGKTRHRVQRLLVRRDHPRGCGENHVGLNATMCMKRITPADAGKTYQCIPSLLEDQDHPRGCGENLRGTCLK